jgi:hypothetical protein
MALLAMPVLATELDRACTRELPGRLPAVSALQQTIDAIFDREATPSIETDNGVTSDFTTMEVLVVRVKDGKPVVACVDTKEAAQRFLAAPAAQLGARTAEEK